jgi:hypothetical protein
VIPPRLITTLAQLSRAKELFDPSKRVYSPLWTILGYLMIISILVVVAALLLRRIFRVVARPKSHLKLFIQLVNVHELSDLEVRTLRRIARQENLNNPAWLFIERNLLRKELNILHDPIVAGLYGKLFGS